MTSCSKEHIEKIKWAIPLVFMLGYFLIRKYFDGNSVEFLTYSLVALSSCVVLLTQLKLMEQKFVAVWIALIIFLLVYFIRFYWITIDALPINRMLPWSSLFKFSTMVEDRVSLLRAFKLSVTAFTCFSLAAAALLFYMRELGSSAYQSADEGRSTLHGLIAKRSLWAVTLFMSVLGYISYAYHIGEMGAQLSDPLPFHLKGVVFYASTIVVPLVILLSIFLAERSGCMITSRVGMLILIMHGVMNMLLRNSRSALLLSLILLIFLMLAGGVKLRLKEKVLFGAMMILGFWMVPIMTVYRSYRTTFNQSVVDAFFSALSNVAQNGSDQIFKGVEFVFFRMPGIECLWNMLARHAEPLGAYSIDVIHQKDGIAGYVTRVIYSYGESMYFPASFVDAQLFAPSLFAPSFVGWCYLVAGLPAIMVGSVLLGILSVLGGKFLNRKYLETGPVAQVFFLWILFMALTEGTLDSMIHMFIVGLITIVFLEASLRLITRMKPFQK